MKINKRLISFSTFALLVFSLFLVSCDEDVATDNVIGDVDYIGIEAAKFVDIPEGETVSAEIYVVASRASNADRTVGLELIDAGTTVDPSNYTAPTSVTIPAGQTMGTFTVDISATDFVKKTIEIALVPDPSFNIAVVDYTESELEDGTVVVDEAEYASVIIYAQRPCTETIVTLSIMTDDWPDETTYELYDLNGTPTVIATGGPYALDNATISEDFCLAPGNYGIVVYDSYGDGISPGGYEISVGDDVLVSGVVGPSLDPGNVSSSSSAQFTID